MQSFHLLSCFLILSYAVYSQSPAQWRGPDRGGVFNETNLLKEWPAAGPYMLWSADGIGKGFSSAVSDGKVVYVTGLKDSTDLLTAISLQGKTLWQTSIGPSWPGAPKTNTITPLFDNGAIYITGGYDHVGVMFRISDDGSRITKMWTDTVLDCHHGGVLLLNGYIYGSNWIDNSRGNWCCLDWKTGKLMWEEKWITKGPIISADGMLYCQEEKSGTIGLVKPDPQKFTLISSFKASLGKGPYWAHPSISNGILYIRHGDVLMAYDIRKK